MRNGRVYELPMQERPTSDSEYSSLPTPKARDHQAEGYEAGLRRASPQVGTILKGLVEGDERVTLLRSPKASEGQGGALGEAEARKRGNTVGVRDQVMDLVASQGHRVSRAVANLPTPTVPAATCVLWKASSRTFSGTANSSGTRERKNQVCGHIFMVSLRIIGY